MKALVTGAGGFIGSRLAQALLSVGQVKGRPLQALALADQKLGDVPANCIAMEGDLSSPVTLERIRDFAPDVTFHLAAVPGGAAEADYALGRRVNLDATLALMETLAGIGGQPRTFVYASSIAVYGTSLPAIVTPETPLRPPLTYGAHKLACEVLLADFTRRGLLDGRSIRLPGIVARPRAPSGLASAFMSDIMHALKAGEAFTCPVSANATAWWMSAGRCADNILHAAQMEVPRDDQGRAWPLPVLRLSMQEIVETLASVYGNDRRALVTYQPQQRLVEVFGRYPELDDSVPRSYGLRDDGGARTLVLRALESNS